MVFQRWKEALKTWERWYEKSGMRQKPLTFDVKWWDFIVDFTIKYLQAKSVIDVGCGTGWFIFKSFKRGVKLGCGIDPSEKCIRDAQGLSKKLSVTGPHFIRGVGEKLPFRNRVFDVAVCIATLDHAFSPDMVLNEINRVLKQHGIFILYQHSSYLVMPIYSSSIHLIMRLPYLGKKLGQKLEMEEIEHHLYYYSYSILRSMLLEHGFRIIKYQTRGFKMPKILRQLLSVIPKMNDVIFSLGNRFPSLSSAIIFLLEKS